MNKPQLAPISRVLWRGHYASLHRAPRPRRRWPDLFPGSSILPFWQDKWQDSPDPCFAVRDSLSGELSRGLKCPNVRSPVRFHDAPIYPDKMSGKMSGQEFRAASWRELVRPRRLRSLPFASICSALESAPICQRKPRETQPPTSFYSKVLQ